MNDLERPVGTYLGRRSYEVLTYWGGPAGLRQAAARRARVRQDLAAADKVVYSKVLEDVSTARTALKRQFDPAAIRQLKAQSECDITVGGSDLAAQAIRAMLVDQYHIFVVPVVDGRRRDRARHVGFSERSLAQGRPRLDA